MRVCVCMYVYMYICICVCVVPESGSVKHVSVWCPRRPEEVVGASAPGITDGVGG